MTVAKKPSIALQKLPTGFGALAFLLPDQLSFGMLIYLSYFISFAFYKAGIRPSRIVFFFRFERIAFFIFRIFY